VEEIDRIWMTGLRNSGKKIVIAGKKAQGPAFIDDFTGKDVPDPLYIKVESSLALPNDMVQRAQIARQLHPDGNLVDLTTIRDQVLNLQDPQLIANRQMEDLIYDNPTSSGAMLAISMLKKAAKIEMLGGDEIGAAQVFRQAAQAIMSTFGATPPGAANPPQPGMSPQVAPPEGGAAGISPDVAAAMAGQVPSGRPARGGQ
jgi:hypothetical protein